MKWVMESCCEGLHVLDEKKEITLLYSKHTLLFDNEQCEVRYEKERNTVIQVRS